MSPVRSRTTTHLGDASGHSGANLQKVLMHGNLVTALRRDEVSLEIGFHFLPGGCVLNVQEIEHEFRHSIGLGQVGRYHVGGIECRHDLVPIPVFHAKQVGGSAQFEPVSEEMMDHVHASAFAVLEDDDSHAGWRHP